MQSAGLAAERCASYDIFCLSVCPSVWHSPVSCQNNSTLRSCSHAVFTIG